MSTATASKSYPKRFKPRGSTCVTPNRKAHAKLSARIGDYARTMDDPANRTKNMTGYHKPGSMQR